MVAILKEPYPLLRPMRVEDLDQVVAIEIGAYEFPWTLGIFRDCLRAGYNCWVLAQSVEVIGYGVLTVAAGEAHILNVCVAQDQQSRGHGRHLMQRLVDLARWHHAERVFLDGGAAQYLDRLVARSRQHVPRRRTAHPLVSA